MNLTATRSAIHNPFQGMTKPHVRTSSVYGLIIVSALAAFEALNFSTTNYALGDLLGDLSFAGVRWATLMTIAFCGLDFAGIASLISQKNKRDNHKESWYLFGAWLLAATFNAILTWWGVTIAISNHSTISSALVNTQSLTNIVPVLVAVMLWVIRILIIGSLTSALERNHASTQNRTAARTASTASAQTGFSGRSEPAYSSRPAQSTTRARQGYSAAANLPKQIHLTRLDEPARKF